MYMAVPAYGQPIDGDVAYASLEAIEAAIVRAVLRGEEKVTALQRTRLRLSAQYLAHGIGTAAPLFASTRPGDLATGLIALKDDPVALADWAGFILLAAEWFEFADNQSAACEKLIAAIWNLAFGARVDAAMLRLAHSLINA